MPKVFCNGCRLFKFYERCGAKKTDVVEDTFRAPRRHIEMPSAETKNARNDCADFVPLVSVVDHIRGWGVRIMCRLLRMSLEY